MVSISEKILKYENFLNERLRGDLKLVNNGQEIILSQLNSYSQLRTFINHLKLKTFCDDGKLKLQTDLACNFYAHCVVPKTDTILIYTGLGYYVEMELDKAIEFIGKREAHLNSELKRLAEKSYTIKAHIKLMLEALRELQGITYDQPENKNYEI